MRGRDDVREDETCWIKRSPRCEKWDKSSGDDTMGFEISCDDTCSGCTNGSALKTAIDALKDICVKIGWRDYDRDYPERNVNHCAYTPGRSTFNLG